MTISDTIKNIKSAENDLYHADFLSSRQLSNREIENIIEIAGILKYIYNNNITLKSFEHGRGVLDLRDNLPRTEFLFSSACNLLGLDVHKYNDDKSMFQHGESLREKITMISHLADIIGICDYRQLGAGHSYMSNAAEILDQNPDAGVPHHRPSLINLLSDADNPVQALADLHYIKNYFGSFENLIGKKLAVSWVYSPTCGQPLSFPQGIINLMPRFGMSICLSHPKGYGLVPDVIDHATETAKNNNADLIICNSMKEAFSEADIVYPMYWDPLSIIQSSSELFSLGDKESLFELEKTCAGINEEFSGWECTCDMMKMTGRGEALLMHYLPVEISGVTCRKGEIEYNVYEKYRSKLYIREQYVPFIIASVILSCKFQNPGSILERSLK